MTQEQIAELRDDIRELRDKMDKSIAELRDRVWRLSLAVAVLSVVVSGGTVAAHFLTI
jgi:hypothetical protein